MATKQSTLANFPSNPVNTNSPLTKSLIFFCDPSAMSINESPLIHPEWEFKYSSIIAFGVSWVVRVAVAVGAASPPTGFLVALGGGRLQKIISAFFWVSRNNLPTYY